eukprot:scaffold50191_cov65-Phaeocystis_antarctica.AAC.7
MPTTAGMLSTAKTTSLSSMHMSTTSIGVARRTPRSWAVRRSGLGSGIGLGLRSGLGLGLGSG